MPEIRVGFSTDTNDINRSGKHRFLFNLTNQLGTMGIKITNKNPDYYIYIPGTHPNKKSKCNVLRLDGLLLTDNSDSRAKNNKIYNSMKQADAIIYQNTFCKRAYDAILGKARCKTACIMNGSEPAEFLPRQPSDFFIANCKWRPFKRLENVIDGFLNGVSRGLKAKLIITGNPYYKVVHEKIQYIGVQKFGQIVDLLSRSIGSVHLSYLDWCPNAMVESIVARCPVIYSDSGGQTEMGLGNGIAVKDHAWNYGYCNHSNPPDLNIDEIGDAFLSMESSNITVNDKRFAISEIATQYIGFLTSL